MKKREESLPSCAQNCLKHSEECGEKECRMWIDYGDEYNCSLISVYINGNMTLSQVASRINLSLVRISQIEKQAINKLMKRIKI